jgi:hypothetical protein
MLKSDFVIAYQKTESACQKILMVKSNTKKDTMEKELITNGNEGLGHLMFEDLSFQ